MLKCECDESRKKHIDDIWLNPKCQNNGQSAAKLRTGESSTIISVKESRLQAIGSRSGGLPIQRDDDMIYASVKAGGVGIDQPAWFSEPFK